MPGCSEGSLGILEQILSILHKKYFVLLEGIIVEGRREVEAHCSRVPQNCRMNLGFLKYAVHLRIERRENLNFFTSSSKNNISSHHPAVISQGLHAHT